jgi:hypothetical protein
MSGLDIGVAWAWPSVASSFLGGIAAGAYSAAVFAHVFGSALDRRTTRVAFLMAFPLVMICLGLWAFEEIRHPRPNKRWSDPGLSDLKALGVLSFASFLGAVAEELRIRPEWLGRVLGGFNRSFLGKAVAVAGVVAALAIGSTVVATTKASWASARWLGAVSLASSFATGLAAMILLAHWRWPDDREAVTARPFAWMGGAIVIELIVWLALSLTLVGLSGLAFQRWPGRLIPFFVVPFGLVVPLILRQSRGARGTVDAAWLVLLGGFVLRAAVAGIPASLTLR